MAAERSAASSTVLRCPGFPLVYCQCYADPAAPQGLLLSIIIVSIPDGLHRPFSRYPSRIAQEATLRKRFRDAETLARASQKSQVKKKSQSDRMKVIKTHFHSGETQDGLYYTVR